MKYAKVVNNKIIDIIQGYAPSDYIPVKQLWSLPSLYPSSFYVTDSNIPVLSVVGAEVHESWNFTLKLAQAVKDDINLLQKTKRQEKQLGSFVTGGMTIYLKDREDSLIIVGLAEVPTNFKISQGQWITLTALQVTQLKADHLAHVQAAYDWEMTENLLVAAMTTLDELKVYLANF